MTLVEDTVLIQFSQKATILFCSSSLRTLRANELRSFAQVMALGIKTEERGTAISIKAVAVLMSPGTSGLHGTYAAANLSLWTP